MRLTAKSIEHLRPIAKRREIPDSGCRGLYLILQPSGARSYAIRYRHRGVPKKLTLKGVTSLADARATATQALRELASGADPAAARKEAAIKAAVAKADTVAAICECYLKREGLRLRTLDQRRAIFAKKIYPVIGDLPVSELRRSEITSLLDKIEDKSGARAADMALAMLRRVFNWHSLRSDDFASPIVRGMGNRFNSKERRRTRVLGDREIASVWAAASAGGAQPYGALIKLALLTSARRGELASLRWDEIDGDGTWTLPAGRSKTKTEITRPLSRAARQIVDQQSRIDGCAYIFSLNGITPTQNFSAPKRALDSASGVADWRFHDLRRTARSLLSRAGVNVDIAERCLGHAMAPIRDTYDKHRYIDEMRHAFEALAAQLDRIVHPPGGKVLEGCFGRSP